MSMITEQVEYLIKLSNKQPFDSNIPTLQRACKEAADTIKQLAAKARPKTGQWKKMVPVYDMIEGKYRMIPYTYKDEELGNPPFYVCDCGNISKKPTRYCPDCGYRMKEVSEL